MQAIQYANQLASQQANQLLQIRGLLIAQQNALATRLQAEADRQRRPRPPTSNFAGAASGPARARLGKGGETLMNSPLTVAALVTVLVTACSPGTAPQDRPALNDEHCKPDALAKIEDQGVRERFADACVRRGGFKPSANQPW
jgi:entry exclusion lipoprotein TrbK